MSRRRSIACVLAVGLLLTACAWAQVPVQDPSPTPGTPSQTSTQPQPRTTQPPIAASPVPNRTTPTWNPQGTSPMGDPAPPRAPQVPVAQPSAADLGPSLTPAEVAASVKLAKEPLSMPTRMTLIRGLNAEFVFCRLTFPFSEKGLLLKAGTSRVLPEGPALRQVIANKGAAAHPGDKGQITAMGFSDKAIIFELNGGPKKKTKWYQRISIGGSSGEVPIAPGPDNSMAHGSILTLEFDRPLPEMTVEQVKQLLAPAFDFSSKTATASYADMMPPKVRQAIKSHQALVGMNREMVNIAKGRPDQKVREREGDTEYEEWIYGYPPQEVAFVRFVGDEVVQVKTMTVDGQRIVRTNREVDFPPGQVPGTASAALAQSAEAQGAAAQPAGQTQTPAAPTARPTLRRAGEAAPDQQPADGTIYTEKRLPGSTPSSQPGSDPTSRTPAPQLPGPPLPPPTTLPGGTPPP